MTDSASTSPALQTALAYFHAWTGHDIGKAMTYIICQAPSGRLEGGSQSLPGTRTAFPGRERDDQRRPGGQRAVDLRRSPAGRVAPDHPPH
jgi:hypothetical protein